MNFEKIRLAMVQSQLRPNGIHDERLLDVYQHLPRHVFSGQTVSESMIKPGSSSIAYLDEDRQVSEGRYMLEPAVEASMMQEAATTPEDLILVIGAWPGALAAVAAKLGSAVIALENDAAKVPELQVLFDANDIPNVFVTQGDLRRGYPERSPYDVIVFGAGVSSVPDHICSQLADGGRAIAVERARMDIPGELCCYRRNKSGVTRTVVGEVFTPLLPEFVSEQTAFVL